MHSIELLTFLFLVGVFTFLEVYQIFSKKKGVIVDVVESPIPLGGMLGGEVVVRMTSGRVVRAKLSGCTQCMGRFTVGDEVHLIRSRSGYSVKIPFMSGRMHTCSHSNVSQPYVES